ncbi:uncharacterized protein PGTG_06548 [Puccinia graminis f. sp. tritici CRL 75-36-700-3]|uniref:Uncharacterized protein n=1 Tax=Puccinia graminis f. sp. tritici (strain CRL 75-36-700-3 / race SCCL) TaxID=418459 RepID=E3K8F2_PUCGT|nr:uncharacterized protein PGTG_06548 [Puccinia graminis f. sp. tritici CRL 75-36-700-3]EFP80592.1 hypothetical protein PGTG_06548 [Puccinia graminis f. sp. tritici CRL 75-36-700-3]
MELSKWLLDQAFTPEHSFPVFGIVPSEKDLRQGNEFGLIQKILLEQISRKRHGKYSLEAAISIIELWYHDFHPTIWEKIKNNHDGCSPEIYLVLILYKAIDSGITVQEDEEILTEWDSLDDLKIPNLRKFPFTMKPERFFTKGLSGDGSINPPIDILKIKQSDFEPNSIKVEGLPARVWKYKNKSETQIFKYRIRLEDGSKASRLNNVISRFNLLDTHLKICHREILCHMNSQGKEVVEDALNSFSDWFKRVLTGKEDQSLPIIGDIETGKVQLNWEDFGKVQIYMGR